MSFAHAARRPALHGGEPRRGPIARYLSRFDEDATLRWAFAGLLIGCTAVLGLDLAEAAREDRVPGPQAFVSIPVHMIVPELISSERVPTQAVSTGEPVRGPASAERGIALRPMTFTMRGEGRLVAEGVIEPGAAARLADELDARGLSIRTVSFDSPGGALDDAIAMGRLIRERRLATEVADGAVCASSCPLAVAGGQVRMAGPAAVIGVHQFYATARSGAAPAAVMADVQLTTARVSRHLIEMGIDPAIWLHALDTPPQQLYYFSPHELEKYRFVTTSRMSDRQQPVKRG